MAQAPARPLIPEHPLSTPVACWAIGGVTLLLLQAVVRLTPIALEPLRRGGLGAVELSAYVGWALVSLYSEGYRGFQRAFVPRSVARAFHLARSAPGPLLVALAPAYAMGLVGARRRRLVTSWTIVAMILVAVTLVRRLPYPWRGVVDGGVVAGLVWGVVSLAITFARALAGSVPEHELDLPT